jgi:2'-5' RNA ligase
MHGVVTLFDKWDDKLIRSLWRELKKDFELEGVYKTPYPHFSYQIAADYDFPKLESLLKKYVSKSEKFNVHASGLGLFTGDQPVLYIPVARSLHLARFQESLWKKIAPTGEGIPAYYEPQFWLPHITLAQLDIDEINLPKMIAKLCNRRFELDIEVNNLAVIYDDGRSQKIRSKFSW